MCSIPSKCENNLEIWKNARGLEDVESSPTTSYLQIGRLVGRKLRISVTIIPVRRAQ